MALTEDTIIQNIAVNNLNEIEVCRLNRILRDETVIQQKPHYDVYAPGSDISHEDSRVQTIASTIWTEEVISAYQAQQEANSLT
jgi:hypothetical protein